MNSAASNNLELLFSPNFTSTYDNNGPERNCPARIAITLKGKYSGFIQTKGEISIEEFNMITRFMKTNRGIFAKFLFWLVLVNISTRISVDPYLDPFSSEHRILCGLKSFKVKITSSYFSTFGSLGFMLENWPVRFDILEQFKFNAPSHANLTSRSWFLLD